MENVCQSESFAAVYIVTQCRSARCHKMCIPWIIIPGKPEHINSGIAQSLFIRSHRQTTSSE